MLNLPFITDMKVKNPNFSLGRMRVRTVIIIENAITKKNGTCESDLNGQYKQVLQGSQLCL